MSELIGGKILVVDDEPDNVEILKLLLKRENFEVVSALNGDRMLELTKKMFFEVIVLDIRMPGKDGIQVLEELYSRDEYPRPLVIILTAYGTKSNIDRALKARVFDILEKPIDNKLLVVKIKNALRHFNTLLKKEQLEEEIFNEYPYENIIGTSPSLRNVLKTIEKIAPTDVCVTITGETGTGKELIARAIHARSNRGDETFKPINAGALPEGTLQSELFGHEKGSFTGAYEKKIGFFESCKNGTLFMDEIGEISQQMQVNLLRVLENKKIIRVGGRDEIPVDVRILTATHQNLEKLVKENKFRKDLYYRIKNFMLHLPPLRERRKDFPVLIAYFIKKLSNKPVEVSDEAIKLLMDYDYPGNIRELKNIIHHAMILMDGRIIRPVDLPADVTGKNNISEISNLLDLPWKEAKQLFEKKYIESILAKADGNVSEVARLTGIDRSDLHKKIEKIKIEK